MRFIEADLGKGPDPSIDELCAEDPALAERLREQVSEYLRLRRELGGDDDGGALIGGQYRLLSLLGRGGMGEVWRARDTKMEREVALKLLLAELDRDPQRLARFEREGRCWRASTTPTSRPCTASTCRASRRSWSWSWWTVRRWPTVSPVAPCR